MKKIIFSIALLSAPLIATANNFNMPGFNNSNGFNNGSSWTMPNMNWGNGTNGNNGFNNGSSWNMPNMNWGNNNNNGNNWSMPSMNLGNANNGYNNGSNWNMPNMSWGNSNNNNNGSNWTMPNMNWGNGNSQPWNFGNNFNNGANYAPNVQYRAPAMPVAPHFIPRLNAQNSVQAPVAKNPAAPVVKTTAQKPSVNSAPATQGKIPMPSEVKGTILAPVNKTLKVEGTK
jgi:hypothetical protein